MCLAFSCRQIPEDEDWLSEVEGNSLQIKVRAVGDAEIVYPVLLYAFAEDGKLASSQTIEDADGNMSLKLSKGEYQLVAISGISTSYQIPTNPSLDDVITFSGTQGADTPLMIGKANVEIDDSSKSTVQITLKYMVASLNIKLKDIPSKVKSVQLSLSPLHSTLSMVGVYGGESQKVKIDCSLIAEGVWSAETAYIFPGSGTETVLSVCLKMDDETEVIYGYTYQGVPEANHSFNVTGSYSGGIIVGGNFNVIDWEGIVEVDFNFGSAIFPDNEDVEIDLTGIPQIGTIWNGMIVADIGESDNTGVDILLMSLKQWENTVSNIDDILSDFSVNGITDWRLPTHSEASVLRARFSGNGLTELNEQIVEYDETLDVLDGEERYLCTKADMFYSFKLIEGSSTTKAGEKRTYYIRLVKTYRMDLN